MAAVMSVAAMSAVDVAVDFVAVAADTAVVAAPFTLVMPVAVVAAIPAAVVTPAAAENRDSRSSACACRRLVRWLC
jgi:hypothetical protein